MAGAKTTLDAIAAKITAEFPKPTPLSRALTRTVNRLIPAEPDAFWVQAEGEDIVIYVLAGSMVHEVRGARRFEASAGEGEDKVPPPTSSSVWKYRVIPLTSEAKVSCDGMQTEAGADFEVKEIKEDWRFDLAADCVIEISATAPAADSIEFAVKLAAAIQTAHSR
jgi:hypothetical protein